MTRFFVLLALVALAGALAGCTHTITTDADAFSVKGPTAPLASGARVALLNGYSSPAITKMASHGSDDFMVDLRQVTDTAIVMAGRHLQTIGVAVDAGAPKKVTMKVTNAEARFQFIPFASRFRTNIDLNAVFDDGAGASVRAESSAVHQMGTGEEAIKRGTEAAAATAVTNLMNEPNFVRYLGK